MEELQVNTTLSSRPRLDSNDTTALTDNQQTSLNTQKVNVRIQNEHYLRKHPEIGVMLESFLQKVLLEKPENIKMFAAGYFTNPHLKDTINTQLKKKQTD